MKATRTIEVDICDVCKLKRVALDRGTTMKAMLAAWIATLKVGKAA